MNHSRHSFALFDYNVNRTIDNLEKISIRNREDLLQTSFRTIGGLGLGVALLFALYLALKFLWKCKKCRHSNGNESESDAESANSKSINVEIENIERDANIPKYSNNSANQSTDIIESEPKKIRKPSNDSLFGAEK